MYYPQASNVLSELLVAGYQKFLEGNIGDLANATQEVKNLMETYGKTGLNVVGHSRGAMTIGNGMESLVRDGAAGQLTDTHVKFVGPAYNAQNAANMLDVLSNGKNTSVQLQVHEDDFVGRLIGNNPATYGERPKESSYIKEVFRTVTAKPKDGTVHGCYGDGSISENCENRYGKAKTRDIQSNRVQKEQERK